MKYESINEYTDKEIMDILYYVLCYNILVTPQPNKIYS